MNKMVESIFKAAQHFLTNLHTDNGVSAKKIYAPIRENNASKNDLNVTGLSVVYCFFLPSFLFSAAPTPCPVGCM